jgi:WD40 repeat protein
LHSARGDETLQRWKRFPPYFKDVSMTAFYFSSFLAFLPRVALGFVLWMAAGPASAAENSDPLPQGALARLGSTRFRHSAEVRSLAFSPDGKILASGGCDEVVRFWDVKTGRQLRVSSRYHLAVAALAYSPDGATLALRDLGLGVFLLDAATAKERRHVNFPRYGGGGPNEETVAFSPNGKILALAAVNPGGEVCLFDPADGKELARLGKHNSDIVPSLTFSPDGRILASSGQDATIRLWDVARRKPLFVLRSEDTMVLPIVFSRDGKWLISGGGTQKNPQESDSPWEHPAIRIWDAATGKQLRVFRDTEVRGTVDSLALAPDGRTLAVRCEDKLRLWDVTTGKVLRTLPCPRNSDGTICKLCFSPNGKLLAEGIGNTIGLWDVASGRLLNLSADESTSGIKSVALSSDGRLLAAGDGDGYLSFWDFRNRRLIRCFRGCDTEVNQVAFSPDGKMLAGISRDDHPRVWDAANGRQRYQIPIGRPKTSHPTMLAFTPDGKLLAYAYFSISNKRHVLQRSIRLLDAATGAERQNLTIGEVLRGYSIDLGFSPDGRHLIGKTGEGEIYGWRREGDRFVAKGLLAREPDHDSVAFTGRGFLTVDTNSGKPPSFHDYETGQPKHNISGFPRLGGILAFSRDGRYLAAGANFSLGGDRMEPRDTTLRVCEMSSGQEVLRWRLPQDTACNELAFAPDGRTLVAAMTDTTILFWDLVPAGKEAAKDMQAAWADLAANDAAKAYRALCRLLAAPADAVALLRSRLKPVENVDEKRLARWIAELDAGEFAVREKATEELRKLDKLAEPALRQALASRPTLEMRRRLQGLLDDVSSWRPPPEILRQLRAIEVLERLGTPEALALLQTLAGGAAGARLTRKARAAVRRLTALDAARP